MPVSHDGLARGWATLGTYGWGHAHGHVPDPDPGRAYPRRRRGEAQRFQRLTGKRRFPVLGFKSPDILFSPKGTGRAHVRRPMRLLAVDEREGLAVVFRKGRLGLELGRAHLGDEALTPGIDGKVSRHAGVTHAVRDWGSSPRPARRGRMRPAK